MIQIPCLAEPVIKPLFLSECFYILSYCRYISIDIFTLNLLSHELFFHAWFHEVIPQTLSDILTTSTLVTPDHAPKVCGCQQHELHQIDIVLFAEYSVHQ